MPQRLGPRASQARAPRRLLVPSDFSASACAALDRAIDLARALDGFIVVLHALESPFHLPSRRADTAMDAARHSAGMALTDVVESRRGSGVPLHVQITEGAAWRVIVDAARELDMDLIVMATHARSGRPQALLGGVTDKVVRMAPCPVLTVPAEPGERP